MNEIPHRSSLVLVDAIGTRITVYANTPQELRALQREYGRRGYRPEGRSRAAASSCRTRSTTRSTGR